MCSALGRGGCLSDCCIPVNLRNASSLGHQGQAVMGHLWVDFANPLALAKQLESVGGGTSWLATERQWENILTALSMGFRNVAGKCLVCVYMPA